MRCDPNWDCSKHFLNVMPKMIFHGPFKNIFKTFSKCLAKCFENVVIKMFLMQPFKNVLKMFCVCWDATNSIEGSGRSDTIAHKQNIHTLVSNY